MRFGVDRRDLEATLVTGLLEALETVCPDEPDIGGALIKAAVGKAWKLARQSARVTHVADIASVAAAHQGTEHPSCGPVESEWAVEVTPLNRRRGLSAPLRFTACPHQVERKRLGMLAERFGLHDIVYRARRPRGAPVGTLSLRPLRSRP
ncbi:hypothetical protein [Actinomadura keratinilytica]